MIYRFSHFRLHPQGLVLTHRGRIVPLPRKVVETLAVLVARAGAVVTKDELLERLWPDGFVEEGNLTQNVYLLRRMLREQGFDRAIETLPRRGYRFTLPVSTDSPPRPGWRRFALAAALSIVVAQASGAASVAPRQGLGAETARLYDVGRYYWNLRTPASMLRSVGYFRIVIAQAPSSPLGYAGLADSFTELADSCATAQCLRWSRQAQDMAHKAAAVDPRSSVAETSLGMVTRLFKHDETASARLFRRAIELDPGNALAHEWYGNLLVAQGELAAARSELELAASLEPIATATYAWLARDCYYQHRYFDAERYAHEALALAPRRVETTIVLGLTYEAQGHYREAADVFRRLHRFADPHDADVLAASVDAKDGKLSRSRLILKLNAPWFAHDAYVAKDLVLAYVTLRSYDAAFKYLARLRFSSKMDRQFFVLDPRLDPIRHDPRIAALI